MLKVNLQPRLVREAREGFQLPLWAPILLGLIMVFGCGGAYWYITIQTSTKESLNKSLELKLRDFQDIIKEAELVREDRDYLNQKRDFISGISTNQAQWDYFFDMLKNNVPKDVWIDSLVMDRSGEFSVEGNTYYYGSVGHFVLRLEAMPQLQTVNIDAVGMKNVSGSENIEESVTKMFKITAQAGLVSPPKAPPPKSTAPKKSAAAM